MVTIEKFPYPVPVTVNLQEPTMDGQDTEWEDACSVLARQLSDELRAAKTAQLSCGEVLIPEKLLPTIARCILLESEKEPCGLRGCSLDIYLETRDHSLVKIRTNLKWEPSISSTFQLSLTLRQDTKWWRLSHLFKSFTKARTLVISEDFLLHKTKLYRNTPHPY